MSSSSWAGQADAALLTLAARSLHRASALKLAMMNPNGPVWAYSWCAGVVLVVKKRGTSRCRSFRQLEVPRLTRWRYLSGMANGRMGDPVAPVSFIGPPMKATSYTSASAISSNQSDSMIGAPAVANM